MARLGQPVNPQAAGTSESFERRCDAAELLWQGTERQRLLDQLDLSLTPSAAGQRVREQATGVSADGRLQVGNDSPIPGSPVTPMPAKFQRGRWDQNDVR